MKKFLLLVLLAVALTATSQAITYTWDGGAGAWEGASWNGGGYAVMSDGNSPGPTYQYYNYVGDDFVIGTGADITSSRRVTLSGGTFTMTNATGTFDSVANYSGLNFGQDGTATTGTIINSALTIKSSGTAGWGMLVKYGTVTVSGGSLDVSGNDGLTGVLGAQYGQLVLKDGVQVSCDQLKIDKKFLANGAYIEIEDADVIATGTTATGDKGIGIGATTDRAIRFTGVAGEGTITSTLQDNVNVKASIRDRLDKGIFYIDSTQINISSDTLTIAQINAELASQIVSGRILQMSEDVGASTETLYLIPEPATIALLGIGGLLLRRRRK